MFTEQLDPGWFGWDLSCVYKRWVGIKREEFSKPFFLPPIYFFEKGSCKVHDEPFQPGLNCLHAFSSFFNPGWNLNLASHLDSGCLVNVRLLFVCVPGWNLCKHSLGVLVAKIENSQLPPCTFSMTELLQWWAFTPSKKTPFAGL